MTQKHLFCFGYGYSCDYLGHNLQASNWKISGTTRSKEKQQDLLSRGIHAHIFDYERPLLDPLSILKDVTHIVISTPPNDEGDPVFKMHGKDFSLLKNLQWVGYLSTTGVYGDKNGDWVDETSEVNPTSQRGSRRQTAENQWLSLHKKENCPVHIFRLAGIYGPGRSALDSVRAGVARRINKPGHNFSRIHAEDIALILEKSMASPQAGNIYNVCDDLPAPSHEVIEYACDLLKRPYPPLVDFEHADLSPMTRSFYMDNKRTRNNKIKEELSVSLKYPDYKAGLKGCLEAEEFALQTLRESENGGIPGFSFSRK